MYQRSILGRKETLIIIAEIQRDAQSHRAATLIFNPKQSLESAGRFPPTLKQKKKKTTSCINKNAGRQTRGSL